MQPTWKSYGFGMPWEKQYGYAQAIQVGPTLYISGQESHDMEANFVGAGDFELQVRTTFANLDRILAFYGARKQHIVQTTVYVKERRRTFDAMARLHAEYFGEHRPRGRRPGTAPPQLVEIGAMDIVSAPPAG